MQTEILLVPKNLLRPLKLCFRKKDKIEVHVKIMNGPFRPQSGFLLCLTLDDLAAWPRLIQRLLSDFEIYTTLRHNLELADSKDEMPPKIMKDNSKDW